MHKHRNEGTAIQPKGWAVLPLSALGEIKSGSTPSRGVPAYWDGEIPWVTPGELTHLKSKYIDTTADYITIAGLNSSSTSLVPRDALLVTTRATIGSVALAAVPMTTNQGFRTVILNEEACPHFYYHLLPRLRSELIRRASGTTFLEISGREFGAVEVPVPPLPEQRRIAEILDTLDETIRKTEQVIAKLKQMKQGLLHDLLTRGIDKNGELRDPERHPEQFKDSTLGRIPREWETSPLQALLLELYRYPTYYGIDYVDEGVYEVRGELIHENGRLSSDEREYRRVSPQTATRFARVNLRAGDFVMTVRGTIGKIALVPPWLEGSVITANLIRMCFDKELVEPRFMRHYLLSGGFQERLDLACSATTIKTIQAPALASIYVSIPSLSEQHRIADVLDRMEEVTYSEVESLSKLRLLKQGLMDDLLTGRVRVPVAEEVSS